MRSNSMGEQGLEHGVRNVYIKKRFRTKRSQHGEKNNKGTIASCKIHSPCVHMHLRGNL